MNDYDNTIILFKNEKWEAGGKQPVYKGNAEFNGKKLNCSLWIKEASGDGKLKKGTKFLSGVFDDWQPSNQSSASPSHNKLDPVGSEDIPF
ncbi:MAG: hypothetical protein VW715_07115 [Rhodospirillales bacterium]|jgi:hypothetical protein